MRGRICLHTNEGTSYIRVYMADVAHHAAFDAGVAARRDSWAIAEVCANDADRGEIAHCSTALINTGIQQPIEEKKS